MDRNTHDSSSADDVLRQLPSVDSLLNQPAIGNLLAEFPRAELVRSIRETLDSCRASIRGGSVAAPDLPALAMAVRQRLHARARPSLRRVINATGVVLHTGLGRAPLADEAVEAIADVARGYSNLEYDLETGRRGDRQSHLRGLLTELTGAADALLVNNNAAATFLTLHALAAGRGVLVSRGELVEIGGSYRMPDIMAAAGCRMIEVGTTNRTHLADYERAIDIDTAVLLRVHTSNYRIAGFVAAAPLAELVKLGRSRGLVVVNDLGSGLLAEVGEAGGGPPEGGAERHVEQSETSCPGSGFPRVARNDDAAASDDFAADADSTLDDSAVSGPHRWNEPTIRDSIAAGADVTLFSGDKLLGGPQAGVILGRADLLSAIRADPLMRTVRPDKMTLAGLEATLRLYRDPASLARKLPVLGMLTATPDDLRRRAQELQRRIAECCPDLQATCEPDRSLAGGGSLPTVAFPTWVVRVRHPARDASGLAAALRRLDVPIICRVSAEALIFDCRTLDGDGGERIAAGLAELSRA